MYLDVFCEPRFFLSMKSAIFLLILLSLIGCHSSSRKPDIDSGPELPASKKKAEEGNTAIHPSPDTAIKAILPCEQLQMNITAKLHHVVDSLVNLQLKYSSRLSALKDCSGIFHRVLNAFRLRCPDLEMPDIANARSSRSIAKWYYEHDQFKLINDALQQSHLIRPGSVMFFGRRWTKYPELTYKTVFRKIQHLGVVVDVQKNSKGLVESFDLFHGRSPGKPASITHWHSRTPSRANLPPFGNYDQQWIGHARILDRAVDVKAVK